MTSVDTEVHLGAARSCIDGIAEERQLIALVIDGSHQIFPREKMPVLRSGQTLQAFVRIPFLAGSKSSSRSGSTVEGEVLDAPARTGAC